MRQLVVVYDGGGNILRAGVHDIDNVTTWKTDGFLEYADGRARPLEPTTQLYDVGQPWVSDLLAWWRHGKYYVDVETQEIVEVDGWRLPEVEHGQTPVEG